jgi:hypothetical protein
MEETTFKKTVISLESLGTDEQDVRRRFAQLQRQFILLLSLCQDLSLIDKDQLVDNIYWLDYLQNETEIFTEE